MKKILVSLALVVGLALGGEAVVAPLEGCGGVGNTIAKTVIDAGLAACLNDNLDVSDEAALREICKWTEDVGPIVRDLLAARKRGMAKASKAGACGPTGGK